MSDHSIHEALRHEVHAIGRDQDVNIIIDRIGDASIVLLGEATHGTREFYRARAEISKRLIAEKGFDAIAVEADWPDALRVSRFVQGSSRYHAKLPAAMPDMLADEALGNFQRFPQWMWRNTDIVALVDWLRSHNQQIEQPERRAGFYGLDLYSLRSSMDAVIRYLSQVDPEAARRARTRYGCFDHLAEDPQRYGYAATFGMKQDCEDEVVRQLIELQSDTQRQLESRLDGLPQSEIDELFYAQQNARVAQNAEAYYRSMFRGRDESWNLRDTHMADTLQALREHLGRRKGGNAKIIVWAHNSHIGDASATEMGERGQLNLGQLVRERADDDCFLLGFTTHAGTVTAASDWDAPAELKTVRPSAADSYERVFHNVHVPGFFLPIRGAQRVQELLSERRTERAIGVLYLPETERVSHYFHANMARQFDAIVHFDETHALQPLDISPHWTYEEVPETYPYGV
ncbi:MAG TPA: erythromycin esterase family protein [Noviherbaspirillum sp.]|nr:erythromycin esterase family protein [Noviherbaspirillum sp.]